MSDQKPRRPWSTDAKWRELSARIAATEDAPPRRFNPGWLAAAAVLIVAVGATKLLVDTRPIATHDVAPIVVTTPPGQRTIVRLPDSSLVTVGAASSVSYVATDSTRVIQLNGIASFAVAHDSRRPFVVRARNAIATDIGTEFVVRGYATDSVVEVVVSSGEVRLSGAGEGGAAVDLIGGDVGRLSASGAVRRARTDSANASLAWMAGRLRFDNASLADVAADLSRWFDVDITVTTPSLRQRRVSAVYNNPSLDGTLNALAATFGARSVRNGRSITLGAAR